MGSSFVIYPAIDIRNGKCVRLTQGDYDQETVYHEDPVEVAKAWEAQGAKWIHLVDLDGAKAGYPVNEALIGRIAAAVQVPVQIGGGLRTFENVKKLLELGVSRVIIGTAAVENQEFAEKVLETYGDQVAVGIDARDGYVATRGWLEMSQIKAEDLAIHFAKKGAKTFIFTDISRDGMMGGPNVEAIVSIAKASGQSVIASGGVSTYEDLILLSQHTADGVSGAITGKALYSKAIELSKALKLV